MTPTEKIINRDPPLPDSNNGIQQARILKVIITMLNDATENMLTMAVKV